MKKVLLAIFLVALSIPTTAQIKCTIKGSVIGRPESKTLILCKEGEDLRTAKTVKINIENGQFYYELEAPYSEIYELTFEEEAQNGSWKPISFYATNDVINFKLHSMDDFPKNEIIGGGEENEIIMYKKAVASETNKKADKIYEITDKLTREQTVSVKGLETLAKLDTASGIAKNRLYTELDELQKTKNFYTPEYYSIVKPIDSIYSAYAKDIEKYDRENPSLSAYSQLISDLTRFQSFEDGYKGDGTPLDNVIGRYKVFSKAYPKHIYTKRAKEMIESAKKIRVGGRYIDFSAPDLDGNIVKLSSEIKGKIAIIDLWASWCGPCRNTSESYIPIYNEFKDSGFTIVGVARESKSDKQMRIAIEKDGYTWTNLIELDDKGSIWAKYGVGNGGGGTFLVDEKGKILVINPTAEEVRKILLEQLK